MKFVVSRLLSGVLALTLAACSGSLIESKKVDYKSAGKAAPLEIPPDLTSPSRVTNSGRCDRLAGVEVWLKRLIRTFPAITIQSMVELGDTVRVSNCSWIRCFW